MTRRRLLSAAKAALRSDRGNVVMMFAIAMPLVVGGAGLGVETTYWQYKKVQLQAAADAASYAGAVEKRRGSGANAISSAAQTAANQNGFPAATTTLGLTYPTSPANSVKVTLQTNAQRFFTAYFKDTPVVVRAASTAAFTYTGASCILALDPSIGQAINISGSAQVKLTGCSIMANSIASNAANVQGSAKVTVPCILSAGGVTISATAVLTACDSPKTQTAIAADPYKTLPAPDKSAMPTRTANTSTLASGYYPNGFSLNSDTVLSGGVYVVGKNFKVNGNSKLTATAGVTIYLTEGATVDMNGTSTTQLQAQTTGPYAGVLFFGDRTASYATNKFNGTNDSLVTGALYFPTQQVEYQGNFAGKNGCTQVVANRVQWTGNTNLSQDCSSLGLDAVPVLGSVRLVG